MKPRLLLPLLSSVSTLFAETITEPVRTLPILEKTDVLVVGGGYAATAAALEAKSAGANVFVVMPRQNPADDLISTRQLWANDDDEGLEDSLIANVFPTLNRATFTYLPSIAAVSPHEDDQHNILKDGVWNDATNNSAQYGTKDEPCSKVTLTVKPVSGDYNITCIKLCYYTGGGDYGGYGTGALSVMADGTAIDGTYSNTSASTYKVIVFTPTTPIPASTQLSLVATTAENCVRQLIGEIILETDTTTVQASTKPTMLFQAIDKALIAAGIPYFTGSPVCDIVRDANGAPVGVVVANRSGRQIITAKAIVDATEWGNVARKTVPLRTGPETTAFTQVVTLSKDADLSALPEGYTFEEKPCQITSVTIADNKPSNGAPSSYVTKTVAFTKSFPLASTDYRKVNEILNTMRTDLWQVSVADWSEKPFFVPPESIVGRTDDPYRPEGIDNLFVAGMLADVSREEAKRLSYLGVSVALGRQLGAAAAAYAATATDVVPASYNAPADSSVATTGAVVRERVTRPLHVGTAIDEQTLPETELPILDDVDVVIVGGGTAGGPAAIGAASEGKRVLLIEWLYCLGGTTTEGRIGTYYHGLDRGFSSAVIDAGTRKANAIGWVLSETKSEWFRHTAVTNGATVLYGSFVEGALMDGTDEQNRAKVRGVVVVLPDGTRGVVKAKVVVDSTGNADVAAAAGAETCFLSPTEFAMQGSAASPHQPGRSYYNTDVGFLNSPDAGDLFTFALRARLGVPADKNWNLSHVHVGARERRRIVGDYTVTPEDELIDKRYYDTIMHGQSDYDMHGFSTTPLMMFHNRPKGQQYLADVPYRALLPRNLDGMLVTGLAISADRDALPIIRMQRDVQNQGYAAGLAAAAAADAGATRAIDIKALQRKLVDMKNLGDRVLTDVDSTYDAEKVQAAVDALDVDFLNLPWILAYPTESLPLLQIAFAAAEDGSDHQKALACALLLLGDETGFSVVAEAFKVADVTAGTNFKGLGNYGRQTSEFDYLMYALMHSKNSSVPAIIARRIPDFVADTTTRTIMPLSHFRMATLAAESLASERISAQLTALLPRNGALSNCYKTDPIAAVSYSSENAMDTERTQAIREIAHLRTRYRFGDEEAKSSLEAYLNDYRTIYASFAAMALEQPQLGKTIGKWSDPDTLVLNLGTPQEPSTLEGRVKVDDAIVQIVGAANIAGSSASFSLVEEGSFEPSSSLLPNSAPSGRDKRGSAATALFSGWTFANTMSGIATDNSYFMEVTGSDIVRTENLPNSGDHSAFVTYKNSQGQIKRTITIEEAASYRLSFYMGSRTYSGKTYNACLITKFNDAVIDTYPETAAQVPSWTLRDIALGELQPGSYTLTFTVPADQGELWNMLDLVKIGKVNESITATSFDRNQFRNLFLNIGTNTTLSLDLDRLDPVQIGGLSVNGTGIVGLVDDSAAYAEGIGALDISALPLAIILK